MQAVGNAREDEVEVLGSSEIADSRVRHASGLLSRYDIVIGAG